MMHFYKTCHNCGMYIDFENDAYTMERNDYGIPVFTCMCCAFDSPDHLFDEYEDDEEDE